jgi:nitrogen regulatory protein P-II 2
MEHKMILRQVKLVTIIALDSLEAKLIQELKRLEVKGYTISEAHGEGLHSIKNSDWEGKNIRIETLVSIEKAERLLEVLSKNYFEIYGVIAFVTNVEVLRPEKFT